MENNEDILYNWSDGVDSFPQREQLTSRDNSMKNFSSIIKPLLEVLEPRHICEIGADLFQNSRFLLSATECWKTKLDIVDIAFEGDDPVVTGSSRVKLYNQKSVQYLSGDVKADTFFIDGDHNYETVSEELRLITQHERWTSLFLHDTGWPCAYRDFYYNEISEELKEECVSSGYISPFNTSNGVHFEGYFKTKEGGEKNGVLKAVEDFCSSSTDSLICCSIPSVFGLTMIFNEKQLTLDQKEQIRVFLSALDFCNPFLSFLELRHLHSLVEIEQAGRVWKENQEYIKILETRLARIEESKI